MSNIKISLCLCIWNNSHLLKRSIHSYMNQTMDTNEYEIILVNDDSKDDVLEIIQPLFNLPNFTYIHMKHPYGMRGCTFGFNTAFKIAQGEILAETTGETILPPDALQIMYDNAMAGRNFCAMKTYNLTPELQFKIDDVDWKSDINNVKSLEGFDNPWTMNNVDNQHFGTHQTSSLKKELFFELFPNGYPLFADYGSEDPFFCGTRSQNGIKDITIMQPMAIHQWHAPFQYWQSKGYAPHLNKWAHSTSNFMGDKSGKVPDGGTRYIWDMEHASTFDSPDEMLSQEEIDNYSKMDDIIRRTGCKLV